MAELEPYEQEVLEAYESGRLASVASKDRQVNIRISSFDLHDLQAKALEEGIPYQTLMASVLHKNVPGRLTERKDP